MLTEIAKRSRLASLLYWWFTQFGVDPRAMARALREFPRYLVDAYRFARSSPDRVFLRPSLHDRGDSAGAVRSEYFWQDAYVARLVFEANPLRHADVGSRIDGFVAHVASFREIEVFDIRPLTVLIPNIKFTQVDLMAQSDRLFSPTPSLSCLHALEHFGLGRYGDKIDVEGYVKGLRSLAAAVAPEGVLYLGCPSGKAKVEFNSHRVIDPLRLVTEAKQVGLVLRGMGMVMPETGVVPLEVSDEQIAEIGSREYSLVIYTFSKSP